MYYCILVALILIIVYQRNSIARFYLKICFFATFLVLWTIIVLPVMLYRRRTPKNAKIEALGLRLASRYILGLSVELDGVENIVQNSNCVIVLNHQSMLDLLVVATLVPFMDDCYYIVKKEVLLIPPFGIAGYLFATIYVDRQKGKKVATTTNTIIKALENRKFRLLLFPEGTRNAGEHLLPFRKGAFRVALSYKCPIQPVAVNRFKFLKDKNFENACVKIKILPAVQSTDYTNETIQELSDKVRQIMSENVE